MYIVKSEGGEEGEGLRKGERQREEKRRREIESLSLSSLYYTQTIRFIFFFLPLSLILRLYEAEKRWRREMSNSIDGVLMKEKERMRERKRKRERDSFTLQYPINFNQ